jgi:hypothetical protein
VKLGRKTGPDFTKIVVKFQSPVETANPAGVYMEKMAVLV